MTDYGRLSVIIPARGLSKGIPRKNLQKVGGKTLLEIAINRGFQSKGTVYVTTEDDEIADLSDKLGAYVIERPKKLSEDSEHAIYPVLHAIKELALPNNDVVAMVLPTTPFVSGAHIHAATRKLTDAQSVVGVTKVGPSNSLRYIGPSGELTPVFSRRTIHSQRQEVPPVYLVTGGIFVSTVGSLWEHGTFHTKTAIPYMLDSNEALDINTLEDLGKAQALVDLNKMKV